MAKEYNNGVVTYDDIGRVAFAYYKADIKRFNAQSQRRIARASHPCDGEKTVFHYGSPEPEIVKSLCWQDNPDFNEWCDNCKYVQPFYESYMEAANKCRVAKARLTRFCKVRLWNEAND